MSPKPNVIMRIISSALVVLYTGIAVYGAFIFFSNYSDDTQNKPMVLLSVNVAVLSFFLFNVYWSTKLLEYYFAHQNPEASKPPILMNWIQKRKTVFAVLVAACLLGSASCLMILQAYGAGSV